MASTGRTDSLPPVIPAIAPARPDLRRDLPPAAALSWLGAGWRDFIRRPGRSG
jgi:hypothetical protein